MCAKWPRFKAAGGKNLFFLLKISVQPSMSTYVSAFDEAPKTPTRSGASTKRKVVYESPENTPPSSPTPLEKRATSRAPMSRMPASKILSKTLKEVVISDKPLDMSQTVPVEGLKSGLSVNPSTDTRSVLEEPLDMGM